MSNDIAVSFFVIGPSDLVEQLISQIQIKLDVNAVIKQDTGADPQIKKIKTLPPRTREALWLSLCGLSTKQISSEMGISIYSVNDHFKTISRLAKRDGFVGNHGITHSGVIAREIVENHATFCNFLPYQITLPRFSTDDKNNMRALYHFISSPSFRRLVFRHDFSFEQGPNGDLSKYQIAVLASLYNSRTAKVALDELGIEYVNGREKIKNLLRRFGVKSRGALLFEVFRNPELHRLVSQYQTIEGGVN